MDASVRLGRIAGVEVGVNWSWLIVFALIVWSLTAAVFPEADPGLGDGTYLGMAIGAVRSRPHAPSGRSRSARPRRGGGTG